MSSNAESIDAGAVGSATRYQQAAWLAFERGAAPPDPSSLSDRALTAMVQAMMQYETPSLLLPIHANVVVEQEWRRRGLSPGYVDRLLGTVMLAVASIGGAVIGWVVFTA